MSDILETWVAPFYMNILHGNNVGNNADPAFVHTAKKALKTISPEIIDTLFAEVNWRCQITAAWFCGMKQWNQYAEIIGNSLLASRVCYAGQGYCFALARFGDARSAYYLAHYLESYLQQPDKWYDQGWAMPALMWIDEKRGTNMSSVFLGEDGLWNRFVADKLITSDAWSLERCKERFYAVMKHSIEAFR
jgi:hypothetical protein